MTHFLPHRTRDGNTASVSNSCRGKQGARDSGDVHQRATVHTFHDMGRFRGTQTTTASIPGPCLDRTQVVHS
jgi:hypothetical protein